METDEPEQPKVPQNLDNYKFDGTTYTYTDKESNITYSWNLEKNQWDVKTDSDEASSKPKIKESKNGSSRLKSDNEEENDSDEESVQVKSEAIRQDLTQGDYSYDGDTYLYTDRSDGTIYFWDKEKKAWFPKIDDTFIAYYQMSYGFTQPSNVVNEVNEKKEPTSSKASKNVPDSSDSLKRKAKAEPEPARWFNLDDEHNTKVYVSNLPLDITETEFIDLMQKYGLVMKDLDSGKMKVKLYTDPVTKTPKGDALCTYIKKESVDNVLKLLDDSEYRGKKIKVERARFTMKGDSYDPSLKPKKKRKKDKEKLKRMQEKLFAWQPDKLRGERSKNERVVVIKNLFDPIIFDENLGLISEYREDIKEECSKCGIVKKVVIYDKHKDGVAQVWFKEAEAADACVPLLNNRWFGKRLVTAETWDGKTKYKVEETKEEAEARLKKWEAFLNSGKDKEEADKDKDEGDDNDAGQGTSTSHAETIDNDTDGTRSSAGSADETDDEDDKSSSK